MADAGRQPSELHLGDRGGSRDDSEENSYNKTAQLNHQEQGLRCPRQETPTVDEDGNDEDEVQRAQEQRELRRQQRSERASRRDQRAATPQEPRPTESDKSDSDVDKPDSFEEKMEDDIPRRRSARLEGKPRKIVKQLLSMLAALEEKCDGDEFAVDLAGHLQSQAHWDVKHHFGRDRVASGEIDTVQVPTTDMIADIMTKCLGRILFQRFRDSLVAL